MYLFFDTETTGFPSDKLGARDPKQGRICQIAAILTDNTGQSFAEFSTLIRPDGWSIGAGAHGVHGITDEECEKFGLDSRTVFEIFKNMVSRADMIVAHNLDFDCKMIAMEAKAHDTFVFMKDAFCTMKATTDICRLPGGRGNSYKWPKLAEALPILCGREIGDDAHDAMVDARACRDIFFALQTHNEAEGLV